MCEHIWRKVYQNGIIMPTPVGWRCKKCDFFVDQNDLTPLGLSGVIIKEYELLGPGNCNDGSRYSKQIQHVDGSVEIIR